MDITIPNIRSKYISIFNGVMGIGGLFIIASSPLFTGQNDPFWLRSTIGGLVFLISLLFYRIPAWKNKYFFYSFYGAVSLIQAWLVVLCLLNTGHNLAYWNQFLVLTVLAGSFFIHFNAYKIYALGVVFLLLLGIFFTLEDALLPYLVFVPLILVFNGVLVQHRGKSISRLQTIASLSEEGPTPIIEISADEHISFVNEQFCLLLGYSREEVIGKPFSYILGQTQEENQVVRMISSGTLTTSEMMLKKKDGTKIHTLFSLTGYRTGSEAVHGAVGTITDITGLKAVELQLKERNEQMDLFLYKATHDLKGPLASVKGILDLALQDSEAEPVKKYLQMALTSTERLDQALIDLLQVVRLNKAELQIEPIDCPELINDILFSLKHMPESVDVMIERRILLNRPFYSDKNTLTTILLNLIVNAIKYKRDGAQAHKVIIAVKLREQALEVEISDNGEGIREEIQHKIFDMFYRGNKKSKGTGLGLYIVKQGVDKLGGTISLNSVPQQGTTFTLVIPEHNIHSFINKTR